MNFADVFLANEITARRLRDAERAAMAAAAARSNPVGSRQPSLRRVVARGFAAISRSSAAAVRRLDAPVADELVRRLA
jgi:hypothetical protein